MRRRGLTLIEVLASTALLTLIAVACVPLLGQALKSLDQESESQDIDLAKIADELLANPAKFGLDADQLAELQEETELVLPPDLQLADADSPTPGHVEVTAMCLRAADPQTEHGWLVIRAAGQRAYRWLKIPKDEPKGSAP